MFGHCADSQTVCRPRPRASFFRLWKFSPTGALALSHEGFGTGSLGPRSIWMSWEEADMTKLDFISLAAAARWLRLLQHLTQPLLHIWPLRRHNRKARRIASDEVSGHPMGTEN